VVALGRQGRLLADGTPRAVVTTDLVTRLYPSVGALTTSTDVTVAPAGTHAPVTDRVPPGHRPSASARP
jgi:iron complex transport system ATP-binding protein